MSISNARISIETKYTAGSTVTGVSGSFTGGETQTLTYTADGEENNEINAVLEMRDQTIAVSTTIELDLSDLIDQFGSTFGFGLIKMIKLHNESTNGAGLYLGGNANAVELFGNANDRIFIPSGAIFLLGGLSTDYPVATVTAITEDQLDLTNASGAFIATYTLEIFGTIAGS